MKKKMIVALMAIMISIILLYIIDLQKLSKERIVDEFLDNKTHFDRVKEYLLPHKSAYNIYDDYENIEDNKLLESIDYLRKNLKYVQMYNYYSEIGGDVYVLFIKKHPSDQEFGIVYTKLSTKFGQRMDPLGDDWYYHWTGYDHQVTHFDILILYIIILVSLIVLIVNLCKLLIRKCFDIMRGKSKK